MALKREMCEFECVKSFLSCEHKMINIQNKFYSLSLLSHLQMRGNWIAKNHFNLRFAEKENNENSSSFKKKIRIQFEIISMSLFIQVFVLQSRAFKRENYQSPSCPPDVLEKRSERHPFIFYDPDFIQPSKKGWRVW